MTAWAWTLDPDKAFLAVDSLASLGGEGAGEVTKLVYVPHLHALIGGMGSMWSAQRYFQHAFAWHRPVAELVAETPELLAAIQTATAQKHHEAGVEVTPHANVIVLWWDEQMRGAVFKGPQYQREEVEKGLVWAFPGLPDEAAPSPEGSQPSAAPGPVPAAPADSAARVLPWAVRTGAALRAFGPLAQAYPGSIGGEIVTATLTQYGCNFMRAGVPNG